MSKHVTLTFAQRIAVLDELKKVCRRDAEGYAVYENGWDDARVAAVVGGSANKRHVASVRKEIIGQLRTNNLGAPAVDQRLTDIEDFLTSRWPDWRSHLGEGKAEK